MGKVFYDDQAYSRRVYVGAVPRRKRYGFFNFMVDCFMTVITGGFWFLWIFVREMRR